MAGVKVSVTLHPQHCTIEQLRGAWRAVDRDAFDGLWTWDHFFPLYGDPDGQHFEGWSLLAAMAAETKRVPFGMLVSCTGYRNPELLADMARTVDHIGGGRLILGIGAGWSERDHREYGYDFGDAPLRLRRLRDALPRIKARLAKLNPPPLGPLPLLIGGGGERVTLRLVAEHADMWNYFAGPVDGLARKMRLIDAWCERFGRDPASIERTLMLSPQTVSSLPAYLELGFRHFVVSCGAPFDLTSACRLHEHVRSVAGRTL